MGQGMLALDVLTEVLPVIEQRVDPLFVRAVLCEPGGTTLYPKSVGYLGFEH